MTTTFDGRS